MGKTLSSLSRSPIHSARSSLRLQRRAALRKIAQLSQQGATPALSPAGDQARTFVDLIRFYGGQQNLSRLSGFSLRSIANYKKRRGGRLLNGPVERKISELDRLKDALATVMRPAAVPGWLNTPNPAFDALKPLEVIERGQMDRIWRMIHILESGSPA